MRHEQQRVVAHARDQSQMGQPRRGGQLTTRPPVPTRISIWEGHPLWLGNEMVEVKRGARELEKNTWQALEWQMHMQVECYVTFA